MNAGAPSAPDPMPWAARAAVGTTADGGPVATGGPLDLLANLGIPSADQQAAEAAEAQEWRSAMLDAAQAQVAALAGLRNQLEQLHIELGDLVERVPAMPRFLRPPPPR